MGCYRNLLSVLEAELAKQLLIIKVVIRDDVRLRITCCGRRKIYRSSEKQMHHPPIYVPGLCQWGLVGGVFWVTKVVLDTRFIPVDERLFDDAL